VRSEEVVDVEDVVATVVNTDAVTKARAKRVVLQVASSHRSVVDSVVAVDVVVLVVPARLQLRRLFNCWFSLAFAIWDYGMVKQGAFCCF
jgi:hypothetical protein